MKCRVELGWAGHRVLHCYTNATQGATHGDTLGVEIERHSWDTSPTQCVRAPLPSFQNQRHTYMTMAEKYLLQYQRNTPLLERHSGCKLNSSLVEARGNLGI